MPNGYEKVLIYDYANFVLQDPVLAEILADANCKLIDSRAIMFQEFVLDALSLQDLPPELHKRLEAAYLYEV